MFKDISYRNSYHHANEMTKTFEWAQGYKGKIHKLQKAPISTNLCFTNWRDSYSHGMLVQQGLEIHGLKECGPWRYTVCNWFPKYLRYTDLDKKPWRCTVFYWVPKHFVHFVRVLHGNTKDVHPSLLRIFGFSAISTYDSNLQSMLKTNELIWCYFQNIWEGLRILQIRLCQQVTNLTPCWHNLIFNVDGWFLTYF